MNTSTILLNGLYATAFTSLLVLSGCNGGGGNTTDTGSLSLNVTDAPIDGAANVYVQFSGVEIKRADESFERFDFDTPKQIDLLNLQGSHSEPLLENVSLPAGQYSNLRLMVDTEGDLDSYIVLNDGSSHELTIPSGAQTGLKLVHGFTVSAGGLTDFTIDFDLRKSITKTGNTNNFKLRPTLRITDNTETGHISGNVDVSTLCPADPLTPPAYSVYVFAGSDISPDDIGSPTAVLTTSLLDDSFNYGIGFLNAGNYTLAVTCIADADDIDLDDDAFGNDTGEGFVATANVTVVNGETTVVDF